MEIYLDLSTLFLFDYTRWRFTVFFLDPKLGWEFTDVLQQGIYLVSDFLHQLLFEQVLFLKVVWDPRANQHYRKQKVNLFVYIGI